MKYADDTKVFPVCDEDLQKPIARTEDEDEILGLNK